MCAIFLAGDAASGRRSVKTTPVDALPGRRILRRQSVAAPATGSLHFRDLIHRYLERTSGHRNISQSAFRIVDFTFPFPQVARSVCNKRSLGGGWISPGSCADKTQLQAHRNPPAPQAGTRWSHSAGFLPAAAVPARRRGRVFPRSSRLHCRADGHLIRAGHPSLRRALIPSGYWVYTIKTEQSSSGGFYQTTCALLRQSALKLSLGTLGP